MIFDKLENCELYYCCNDGFKAGFDFIKKAIAENLEVGKYAIDGDKVRGIVQEYSPKEDSNRFEGHKDFIDIQFIVSGCEFMESADENTCSPTDEYNTEKDVQHFTADSLTAKFECDKNTFAIFFPHDIHKPGIKLKEGVTVKKVVVKVHI
ncbi:MAG: DUF386 domain-containing protein [Ruminococcaceae bacterium]|nr:DUF386 domain-containing protein [Oscillospiraceae bacterium]